MAEFVMNHYQQLIADEILSVQGQKDYCLTVLGAALKAGNRRNTP